MSGYRFSKNIQRFIHMFFQKANRIESVSKLDCSNIIVIVFYNNHKAARLYTNEFH